MTMYYIYRNGQQEGPFDIQTIIYMNLNGDTLVWCEGMSNWTPISQVPELQQAYQVVPPPFTHNVPPQFPNQGPPQYGQEYQQQNDYQQQYEENKKEFFKELLKILACLVIVGLVFLYKCSGDSNTTDDADVQVTEQTQESETESQNSTYEQKKEAEERNMLGTYEVTDKVGCTFRLTINEDKTANITGVRGENVTYYCSWSDFSVYDAGISIKFSGERPLLYFEGGDNRGTGIYSFLSDGWFYATMEAAQARNPNWRLKAKKIN